MEAFFLHKWIYKFSSWLYMKGGLHLLRYSTVNEHNKKAPNPKIWGLSSRSWARTNDPLINSQML